MNFKAHEQENLINKLGAFIEEKETIILMGQEAESATETSLLAPATFPLEEKDSLAEELSRDKEKDFVLSSNQNQQELLQPSSLQEVELKEYFTKETTQPRSDIQMQTLQVYYCIKCL